MSAASIEKAPVVDADLAALRAAVLREADRLEAIKPTLAGETASAQEARSAAVWFVKMEISTQVHIGSAEEAEWRDGSPPTWAFPLTLPFPHKGHVGRVGEVLVDARTCDVLDDPERVSRIEADVRELARRTVG